jgi:hypothetical protein
MNAHKWFTAWLNEEKSLKEIKLRELETLDYHKQWQIIDEMLPWACDHRIERNDTGLLELQKFILQNRDKIKQGAS